MKKIVNTCEFIHKNGMNGFLKECYYRMIDNYYETYFDVTTTGLISKEDLRIDHHESVEYSSVCYRHTIKILNKLPVDKTTSTLLDYGCGKGRVIIAAAACRYRKILGVELADIINIARSNIDKMRHRKTKDIVLIQCDAQDFDVPSDVNIFYFFNPFIGSLLENVTRNIHSSYVETPRKIYVVFFNNDHFDKVIAHQDWLTKIYQSKLHLNISCGVYETAS